MIDHIRTAICYECGDRFLREQMVRCTVCHEPLCETCAADHPIHSASRPPSDQPPF